MVAISGGTFNNGTSNVTISAFYMSQYDITQSQYQTVMGTNPSYFIGNSDVGVLPGGAGALVRCPGVLQQAFHDGRTHTSVFHLRQFNAE